MGTLRQIDDDYEQLERDILMLVRQYRLSEECCEDEGLLLKELRLQREDLRAKCAAAENALIAARFDAKEAKAQRDEAIAERDKHKSQRDAEIDLNVLNALEATGDDRRRTMEELQDYFGSTRRLIKDISKFISELLATDAWQEMPEYVVLEHTELTRRIAHFLRQCE